MQAFLVVGPESSGNRYLTRLLCQCGCAGAGSTAQPFDVGKTGSISIPEPLPDKVAIIRSFPYAGKWLKLESLIDSLRALKYEVTVLITIRNPRTVEMSQVRAGHVLSAKEARYNISRAYKDIFYGLILMRCPYFMVLHEELAHQDYVEWMLGRLELQPVTDLEPFVSGGLI